jgi:hypothetical protein
MSARESAQLQASDNLCVDRRAFVRLACDLDASCRAIGRIREVGWPGKVRDISPGGIGLLTTHRFQPGTQLAVELRDHAGAARRTIRVRVVHATATHHDGNSCWLFCCTLDTPFAEVELEELR